MNRLIPLLLSAILAPCSASAAIRLPAIVSDHAVLQAGKPVAVWGWATSGARVTVEFIRGGDSAARAAFQATADSRGKWSGRLPALATGTAGRLVIASNRDSAVTVSDLLVGEVWLGGGQSNMVYSISGKYGADPTNPAEVAQVARNVATARREAANLAEPIRYFEVATRDLVHPDDDVVGRWVEAGPGNVSSFSAVAWNFAAALQRRLHAPIGLVVSCVGGTPVEYWMSRPAIDATAAGAAVEERYREIVAYVTAYVEAATRAWFLANPTPELQMKNRGSMPVPFVPGDFNKVPARFYNGMIHGLEPYTLRGVIWFQADGNRRRPLDYGELFRALIRDWRAHWGEQLPFYFVEMNNMVSDPQARPVEPDSLCLIREQQHAGLEEPGVGMVVSIDLGTKNAHFPNKKPVGERLARLALRDCYHLPMGEVDSPIFRGYRIEGSRIRLQFDHAAGLRVRGRFWTGRFAIRGASGDWAWADSRIEGSDILVWNHSIPAPAAVRYAWAPNPLVSVENGACLPLSPFRTDTGARE